MKEQASEDKGTAHRKARQELVQPARDFSPPTVDQMQGPVNPGLLRRMQRTLGNSVVQRFLARRSRGIASEKPAARAADVQLQQEEPASSDGTSIQILTPYSAQDFDGGAYNTRITIERGQSEAG